MPHEGSGFLREGRRVSATADTNYHISAQMQWSVVICQHRYLSLTHEDVPLGSRWKARVELRGNMAEAGSTKLDCSGPAMKGERCFDHQSV